jgi:hypothetical protein
MSHRARIDDDGSGVGPLAVVRAVALAGATLASSLAHLCSPLPLA